MIDVDKIRTNLIGVVGLRQPIDPDFFTLDSDITTGSSGKYFDQFSSYVTPENIKDTQPYAGISEAQFNTYLTEKIKDSVSKGLAACFDENDLVENRLLFDNALRRNDELDNDGDFVGYQVAISKRKDLKVIVNSVICEFSGTGTIKLLLFNDNYEGVIESKEITIDSSNVKETLNWELPYSEDYAGGKFYIGYLNDGLDVKAYNRSYGLANSKNVFNATRLEQVKVEDWNSEALFDIEDVDFVAPTHGLNFDISVVKDYTSYIINNKSIFADVIGYQFAADILGMMITTNRTTGIERLQKGNLLLELQGNFTNDELPTLTGVNTKLKEAIKQAKQNIDKEPLMQKFTIR